MNSDETSKKLHDFAVRREEILVKIKEQKLKLARLELHVTQFMADLAAADQPNEEAK